MAVCTWDCENNERDLKASTGEAVMAAAALRSVLILTGGSAPPPRQAPEGPAHTALSSAPAALFQAPAHEHSERSARKKAHVNTEEQGVALCF